MSPIQQMLLGVGAVATKTYVDDIFSTFLYTGTGSARSINNGIDLAGEGGLAWVKRRNLAESHIIVDTARGATNWIASNESDASNSGSGFTSFNSTGFSVGTGNHINGNNHTYAGWTFRKAPGFFDVVTISLSSYSTNQRVSHSLGCIPGLILLKNTNNSEDWRVYHRELGRSKYLSLNGNGGSTTSNGAWGSNPTTTDFGINTTNLSVGMPSTYVAYVFAGGESGATGANSLDCDGSSGYLSLASSSDFAFGTGDFTIEFWVRPHSTSGANQLFDFRTDGGSANQTGKSNLLLKIGDEVVFKGPSNTPDIGVPHSRNPVNPNTWSHIAVVRNSSTTTVYVNGIAGNSASDSNNYTDATLLIGKSSQSSYPNYLDGQISNFRVVKGTAVYTSSFRPPTAPLTNITNTKLLCCNTSTATGSTVTPGTITATGAAYDKSSSPFDDPAGFVFGDSGDQNVIKSGSYVGASSDVHVYTGGEAQWVMVKNTSRSETDWYIVDVMRGAPAEGADNCKLLLANTNAAEGDLSQLIVPTATGFTARTGGGYAVNYNGDTYIFLALRRPDGYVGRPPELGTSVFNMVMGANNPTYPPSFVSGFPVDFAFNKNPNITEDLWTQARLTGDKYLRANATAGQGTSANNKWEYNNGWYGATNNQSSYQSWMWKRHAGFDVVTFEGTNTAGLQIGHSLGKTPEMIWLKNRDATENWSVYHKGLNGGSNQGHFAINLNSDNAEIDTDGYWNDTAPTATAFTVGNSGAANGFEMSMIAMLFASVEGISKCGYYTGNSSTRTITVGFQPRYLIIKKTSSGTGRAWYQLDTTLGWVAGNHNFLEMDKTGPKSSYNLGVPTGTGFTLENNDGTNGSGSNYIYYAHA